MVRDLLGAVVPYDDLLDDSVQPRPTKQGRDQEDVGESRPVEYDGSSVCSRRVSDARGTDMSKLLKTIAHRRYRQVASGMRRKRVQLLQLPIQLRGISTHQKTRPRPPRNANTYRDEENNAYPEDRFPTRSTRRGGR